MTPDKLFHVCDLFPALLSAFSIGGCGRGAVDSSFQARRPLLWCVGPSAARTGWPQSDHRVV